VTFEPQAILFWSVAALWWLLALGLLRDLRAVRPLPPLGERREPLPRVSVIMAARNEERRIERAVRGLLAQRGIEAEIVVVDDRSDDRTAEILARLAAEDSRLRVLRVDELPRGWLGKPHACELGAREASGEWLLFTDADAWLRPELIARAVGAAAAERAEHVCLMPRDHPTTLWARAALINFICGGILLAARVNRDRRHAAVGIGAFNLVRAERYRAVDGHRRLRMEVLDDVGLGLLLSRVGCRARVFWATDDLEVQWAGSAVGLIRAVEKNSFAVLRFSLARVLLALAVIGAACAATLWTVTGGGGAGIVAVAGFAATLLPAWIVSRRSGWGLLPALLAPLSGAILVVAMLNSTLSTVRRGGIRWRETFYPLKELRRGILR